MSGRSPSKHKLQSGTICQLHEDESVRPEVTRMLRRERLDEVCNGCSDCDVVLRHEMRRAAAPVLTGRWGDTRVPAATDLRLRHQKKPGLGRGHFFDAVPPGAAVSANSQRIAKAVRRGWNSIHRIVSEWH